MFIERDGMKIGWQPRIAGWVSWVILACIAALAFIACSENGEQGSPTSGVEPVNPVSEPEPTGAPGTTPLVPTPASIPLTTALKASTPVSTAEPTSQPPDFSRFAGIDGILDPTNFGWPRTVETSEGFVTLDAPPAKVHSLSLGHAEILAALMDFERLAAVYSFFADEEQSNIAILSAGHSMIGFDPEEVVALEPDLIIASRFTNADTVAFMKDAGIPVVRTNLENSALGNVPNILLIGYMIGAEVESLQLVSQIESRMQFISDLLPEGAKPRVLSASKFTSAFAAGSGTTEGGIIEQAGGINAAGDSGIEGHQQVSIESVAAINPDVIIVPQPVDGAEDYIEELITSAALAEVPAVKNGRVYYVLPKHHTTLSHWNVIGIEQLASLLYPSVFSEVTFETFQHFVR